MRERERERERGVVAYGPKDKSRMPNFSGPRNGPQKKRRRKNTGWEGERESVVASGPKAKSKIPNFSLPRKWPTEERRKSARREKEREGRGSL
jgi:hypothetical protein